MPGKRVGSALEGEGHRYGCKFCGEQKNQGPNHPQLQIAAIRGPNIGPKVDQGCQQRSAIRGYVRVSIGWMAMIAHSGSSYRGILAGNHLGDSGRQSPCPGSDASLYRFSVAALTMPQAQCT